MKTAYETCYSCHGSGLQDGLDSVTDCWVCNGQCVIRMRDTKGRFISKESE